MKPRSHYFIFPGLTHKSPSIQYIVRACCEYFECNEDDLKKRCRHSGVILKKHLIIWLLVKKTNAKKREICRYFNLNHSLMPHILNKIDGFVEVNSPEGLIAIDLLNKIK